MHANSDSESVADIFLIQFSPSPARQERLNIGLITVRDGVLDFGFDPDIEHKVSRFYGTEWAVPCVIGQCVYLERWLNVLKLRGGNPSESVQNFSRELANEILIAGPYKRVSSDFETLFEELVAAPK